MAKTGRKSMREELGILRRYSDLTEPYFKFLKDCLEGDDKDDKKWAADNLKNAFAKMIPQTLDGMGDNGEIQIQIVNYGDKPALPVPAEGLSDSPTEGD
jgi:hypothetical protein